jgi:hypothetical protein
VVKWVSIADLDDHPISALGIGQARSRHDVVLRVKRFLPQAKIACSENPVEADTPVTCEAMLGKGWIRLFFDRVGSLKEARIDAYHFT